MTKLVFPMVLLFAFLIPQTSGSQEGGAQKQDSMLRSPVQLLPGYRTHLGAGVEGATIVRIWKEGGLTILGSVGCCYAAEATTVEKDRILWREQQEINGKRVTMVYTKQQELVVSFTDDKGSYPANFTPPFVANTTSPRCYLWCLHSTVHAAIRENQDNQTLATRQPRTELD